MGYSCPMRCKLCRHNMANCSQNLRLPRDFTHPFLAYASADKPSFNLFFFIGREPSFAESFHHQAYVGINGIPRRSAPFPFLCFNNEAEKRPRYTKAFTFRHVRYRLLISLPLLLFVIKSGNLEKRYQPLNENTLFKADQNCQLA